MMKVYPATIVFFFSFLGREIIEIERDKNWNVTAQSTHWTRCWISLKLDGQEGMPSLSETIGLLEYHCRMICV